MSEILFICLVALLVIVVILELAQFRRNAAVDLPGIQQSFDSIEKSHQMLDRSLKDEIARAREETRLLLAEQKHALQAMTDSFNQSFAEMRSGLEKKLDALQKENAGKLDQANKDFAAQARTVSREMAATLNEFNQAQLKSYEALATSFAEAAQSQKTQLDALAARTDKHTSASDRKLDGIQIGIEAKLAGAKDDAAKQLEQARAAMDAKLASVEKRLSESFQQVAKQLEQVQKELAHRAKTGTA